jgi:large subunit ribosomal protein L10
MPTGKKQAMAAQLAERLSRSHLVVLTDYRGLNMKDLTSLRRGLEKAGAGYHVVKNTLLALALGQVSIQGLDRYLVGPTAVVFAYEDPINSARVLKEQVLNFPSVQIRGGWMEGRVLSADAVKALADLPSRPVLLGQVVGMLQGPMASLVSTLAGAMRQLLYVLQARVEKGPEPGAEAGVA